MVPRALSFVSRQLARAGALLGYAACGALRSAELRRRMEAEWDEYAGRESQEGLHPRERDFYLGPLRPGQRVLLVGCGGGRDLIGLLESGLRVDGLDIARRAVALCRERLRERGFEARLFDCAVEEAPFEAPYDAAVFTWLGYGYIPEAARRQRTLVALRDALRPEGRILLSYALRAPSSSGAPAALGRLVAVLTRSDWRLERGDYVELSGRPKAPALHFEHRFLPEEIVVETQAAGLRVLSHERADEGRLVLIRD